MAKRKSSAGRKRKQCAVHPHAAGIDIGAEKHFVAVRPGAAEENVRCFEAFTASLYSLANWLKECGVKTVAMESTGVYWIPLFEILEERGFEVFLVDTHRLKSVPGRKSDVLDCQWIQELHTFGLLAPAFRPEDEICKLRAYLRQRSNLVRYASQHIQHMEKALTQMNVKLQHVVSDITGKTALRILDAILAGERDPHKLAQLRDPRCRNPLARITASLHGNWREEHLFELRQALELFRIYQEKVRDCDAEIKRFLETFETRTDEPPPASKLRKHSRSESNKELRATLFRIAGVDVTSIDGIDTSNALTLFGETGLDMERWPSDKHFTSWLALAPGTCVSGGKRFRRGAKTKASANRAAAAFRLAAQSLHRSPTALRAYFRRLKARIEAPKALTATARKIAQLYYKVLRYGKQYVDAGQTYYDQRYRQRALKNLQRRADTFGYKLVPQEALEPLDAR
jgi:transposase